MTKEEVFELLQGSRVMTTGKIESVKPCYNRTKLGKTYRSGYKIAIRTPHNVVSHNEKIPIFISVHGKSSAWHSYHILQKTKQPISISGFRQTTKIYPDKKNKKKRVIWVILKKTPSPTMIYMGGNIYSFLEKTNYS